MKRVLFLLSVLVSVVSSSAQVELEECVVDAFNYLNAVRQNPSAYSGKIGVDLGEVEPRPALQWNESLIRAAGVVLRNWRVWSM